jgi:hypothetical protein
VVHRGRHAAWSDYPANIAKRPEGQWRARYRDDAGKEHSRHSSRKIDAQNRLDSVTQSCRPEPRSISHAPESRSARWPSNADGKVNLKPSTFALYESILGTTFSRAGSMRY